MKCSKCRKPMTQGSDGGNHVFACIPCDRLVQIPMAGDTTQHSPESRVRTTVTDPRLTKKGNKYHNVVTVVNDISFQSKKEADRYLELTLMQASGEISDLTLQPLYNLCVEGILICKYKADFAYFKDGAWIVEDVKGMKTAVYRLKKKMMKAIHGMDIVEI